jgi:hypothetical protein
VYSIGQLPRVLLYGFENTGGAGTHTGHTGSKTPGGNTVPVHKTPGKTKQNSGTSFPPNRATSPMQTELCPHSDRPTDERNHTCENGKSNRERILNEPSTPLTTSRGQQRLFAGPRNRLKLDWTCRQPDRTQVHVSSVGAYGRLLGLSHRSGLLDLGRRPTSRPYRIHQARTTTTSTTTAPAPHRQTACTVVMCTASSRLTQLSDSQLVFGGLVLLVLGHRPLGAVRLLRNTSCHRRRRERLVFGGLVL